MVGSFKPGEVYHIDTHKKKSLTRQTSQVSTSSISGKPINPHDIKIELSSGQIHLSLEDALDLNLCQAFNVVDMGQMERFNPFNLHFEQQLAKRRLGFYV